MRRGCCCVSPWTGTGTARLLLLLQALAGTRRAAFRARGANLTLPCPPAAAAASQCWQGATFSQAVEAPGVASGGTVPVPGAASLAECVSACCRLAAGELAWLLQGRCYLLRCQQRAGRRPRERPGADSLLAFLRRAAPQVPAAPPPPNLEGPGNLDSLRGHPEGGRLHQSEAPRGEGPGQGPTGSDQRGQGAEGGGRSPAEPHGHRQVSAQRPHRTWKPPLHPH